MYRELNIDTDYDKQIVDAIVDGYFVEYLFNSKFNYFEKSIFPLLKINVDKLKNNYGFKSKFNTYTHHYKSRLINDDYEIKYEFIIDTPFGELKIYHTVQVYQWHTEILSINYGSDYIEYNSECGYFSSRKNITFDKKIGHHFSIKATKNAYK